MNISRSSAQGTHISEINFNNIWVFFSSASDDINIRQTRRPKGEVDENRVKKSAQAKLTLFVVFTDHIIIICGMVYGTTRRNLLEMKINPVKVYAQYFIPNLTLILWRPVYHC